MLTSNYTFSRLRRQYKYAGKRIMRALQTGSKPSARLLARFRALTKKLAPTLGSKGLQRILGSAAGVLSLVLSAHAQQPNLDNPTINPFGLDTNQLDAFYVPTLVDIDGDGDLDLFQSVYSGLFDGYASTELNFFENTGTPEEPVFQPPISNPFGFQAEDAGTYVNANYADFDGDGDTDILAQIFDYADTLAFGEKLSYYENIGSPSIPQFATPIDAPFDLPAPAGPGYYRTFVNGDLDGDGDVDLLMYTGTYSGFYPTGREVSFLENIPLSNGQPDFQDEIITPFGLDDLAQFDEEEYNVPTQMVDLDGDGDLDIIGSVNRYDYDTYTEENGILFIENTGNSNQAEFGDIQYIFPDVDNDGSSDFIIPFTSDLDNDGDLDVFGVNGDFGFVFFENPTISSIREEAIELKIELFPNPASDFIHLRTQENISEYIIIDRVGRELKRIPGSSTEIPIEYLPAGQYWLKAVTSDLSFGIFSVVKR